MFEKTRATIQKTLKVTFSYYEKTIKTISLASSQQFYMWLFILHLHCCQPDRAVWPYKKPKQLDNVMSKVTQSRSSFRGTHCRLTLAFWFVDATFRSRDMRCRVRKWQKEWSKILCFPPNSKSPIFVGRGCSDGASGGRQEGPGPTLQEKLAPVGGAVARVFLMYLSLIHIWRCRRSTLCRSRWSPYH